MKRSIVAFLGIAAMTTFAFAEPAKDKPKDKGTEPAKAPAKEEKAMNIVETAAGNKDFSTLVELVKAAGLADALSAKGEMTVFAPTNDAFAKLPKETLESLKKPENKEQLKAILTYHVLNAKVMAKDVKAGESPKTIQGTSFKIAVKDGKVSVGNDKGMANVTKTDIACSNGVIHVIDSVILPADAKKKDADKKEEHKDKKGAH